MPLDPRANAPERIAAPAPLPHVSRRALKRVKNPIPAPADCRYCGDDVHLVCNSEIYRGRSFGDWPYAYLCRGCRAYVGLHPQTDIPLGTLADDKLRVLRNRSKAAFHDHMKKAGMTRTGAYQWLAEKMGIDVGVCHFGWFDHAECLAAESIVEQSGPQTAMAKAFAKAK
ncbi:zinc-finger-containing protein [Pseudomonas sp. FP1762]|uniref:zinc-finger-containing protein n=1 Tax=Pseudomonas sp. FP1762 TaxID=2954080 RepID=UPI0027374CB5|nr:zinc-finger-containing protein [Pseudomonas sp. FP1762]WLG64812.1 zinc-finger-containing protein [Pseudomonas sp. FP1762]